MAQYASQILLAILDPTINHFCDSVEWQISGEPVYKLYFDVRLASVEKPRCVCAK